MSSFSKRILGIFDFWTFQMSRKMSRKKDTLSNVHEKLDILQCWKLSLELGEKTRLQHF